MDEEEFPNVHAESAGVADRAADPPVLGGVPEPEPPGADLPVPALAPVPVAAPHLHPTKVRLLQTD